MEPKNLFDTFFSIQNPAIIVLVFFAVISVIVFLIKKDIIKPLERKKEKLAVENLKLMALFAELDPDPILRVDDKGIIIKMNDPAKDLFSEANTLNQRCDKLIPNYEELKKNTLSDNQEILINGNYFTISIKESSHLEFTQIYLHDISYRIEQEKLIKRYQKNLKLLRVKLDEINEREREKISKELHDHIGNKISIFKLSLQSYIANPDENDRDELFRKIDFLSEEVRGISRQLSPIMLKEFGLIPALTSLVEEMTKNSNIKGHLANINYEENDNINLKLGAYRICEEALNNIVKHSQCNEFEIQIIVEDNYLKVMISDDGIGFSKKELSNRDVPTLGLFNMKERAESLNGSFELDSSEGKGTTIYLEFFVGSEI